jgi:hypothetical protein
LDTNETKEVSLPTIMGVRFDVPAHTVCLERVVQPESSPVSPSVAGFHATANGPSDSILYHAEPGGFRASISGHSVPVRSRS